MKDILTIAKKEFLDTLRDKRTLITMVVIPLLLFPILMTVVTKIQSSATKEAMSKELTIGVINDSQNESFEEFLSTDAFNINLITPSDTNVFIQQLKDDTLDAAFYIPADFDAELSSLRTAKLFWYYKSTEQEVNDRLEQYLDIYKDSVIMKQRMAQLKISQRELTPLMIVRHKDASSITEVIAKYAGGILPYIFIIFCFIGCMYPAIDLFTGEKERGTIETILTVPVKRWNILVGKMMVIASTGFLSACLAMVGLFAAIQITDTLPPEIITVVNSVLSPEFIITLFVMLLPLTIFFAGIMIPIAIYARNFKEAQSIITPLNIAIIIPAMLGFLPGIELNAATAITPIMNIVLCTKEAMAGTLPIGLFALTLSSLIVYATITSYLSVKWFGKESSVLR